MEIAIVDCLRESSLTLSLPEKFKIIVFCVSEEIIQPRPGIDRLCDEDVPTPDCGQLKLWTRIRGELEIGYLCGRFSIKEGHKVTIFTDRPTIRPDSSLFAVEIAHLHPPSLGPTPSETPCDDSSYLFSQFVFDLCALSISVFSRERISAPQKETSLRKRVTNWASNLISSAAKRLPPRTSLPSIEELALAGFKELVRIRVLVAESGKMKITLPEVEEGEVEGWLRRELSAHRTDLTSG